MRSVIALVALALAATFDGASASRCVPSKPPSSASKASGDSNTVVPTATETGTSASSTATSGPRVVKNEVSNGGFAAQGAEGDPIPAYTVSGDGTRVQGQGYTGDKSTDRDCAGLSASSTGGGGSGTSRKRQVAGSWVSIAQSMSNLNVRSLYTVRFFYYVQTAPSANWCQMNAWLGNNLFYSTWIISNGPMQQWVTVLEQTSVPESEAPLMVSLVCLEGGISMLLIDSIFMSNQVTPANIDDFELDFAEDEPVAPGATSAPPANPTFAGEPASSTVSFQSAESTTQAEAGTSTGNSSGFTTATHRDQPTETAAHTGGADTTLNTNASTAQGSTPTETASQPASTPGSNDGFSATTGTDNGFQSTTGTNDEFQTATGPSDGFQTSTGPSEGSQATTPGPNNGSQTTTGTGEGFQTTTGPNDGFQTTTGADKGFQTTTTPNGVLQTTTTPNGGFQTTTAPNVGSQTTTSGPEEPSTVNTTPVGTPTPGSGPTIPNRPIIAPTADDCCRQDLSQPASDVCDAHGYYGGFQSLVDPSSQFGGAFDSLPDNSKCAVMCELLDGCEAYAMIPGAAEGDAKCYISYSRMDQQHMSYQAPTEPLQPQNKIFNNVECYTCADCPVPTTTALPVFDRDLEPAPADNCCTVINNYPQDGVCDVKGVYAESVPPYSVPDQYANAFPELKGHIERCMAICTEIGSDCQAVAYDIPFDRCVFTSERLLAKRMYYQDNGQYRWTNKDCYSCQSCFPSSDATTSQPAGGYITTTTPPQEPSTMTTAALSTTSASVPDNRICNQGGSFTGGGQTQYQDIQRTTLNECYWACKTGPFTCHTFSYSNVARWCRLFNLSPTDIGFVAVDGAPDHFYESTCAEPDPQVRTLPFASCDRMGDWPTQGNVGIGGTQKLCQQQCTEQNCALFAWSAQLGGYCYLFLEGTWDTIGYTSVPGGEWNYYSQDCLTAGSNSAPSPTTTSQPATISSAAPEITVSSLATTSQAQTTTSSAAPEITGGRVCGQKGATSIPANVQYQDTAHINSEEECYALCHYGFFSCQSWLYNSISTTCRLFNTDSVGVHFTQMDNAIEVFYDYDCDEPKDALICGVAGVWSSGTANTKDTPWVSVQQCWQMCQTDTDFGCKGFLYNQPAGNVCVMFDQTLEMVRFSPYATVEYFYDKNCPQPSSSTRKMKKRRDQR